MNRVSRRGHRLLVAPWIVAALASGAAWSNCPSEVFLYVGVWSPAKLYRYCLPSSGVPAYQAVQSAPGDVRDLAVGPDGTFLYYASANLTAYTIAASGALTQRATATQGNGAFDDLTLDPGGEHLYGTHSFAGGVVNVYELQLGLPWQVQQVNRPIYPRGVALGASGEQLFVANQADFLSGLPDQDEIGELPVQLDGTLDDASYGHTSWSAFADYLAAHPSGELLIFTEGPGGRLRSARIEPGGGLSPLAATYSGAGASQLVLNAAGSRAYVVNEGSDTVSVFGVGASDGSLTLLDVESTGDLPRHVLLHPLAPILYVATAGGAFSQISVFAIAADGTLTPLATVPLADPGAYRMAIGGPSSVPCPPPEGGDADGDGVCSSSDNCPQDFNPAQEDSDGNGIGDVCQIAGGVARINEVHYEKGPGGYEYVELYVPQGPVDLTGWQLTDLDGESLTFDPADPRFPCPVPFVLQSGERLVVWQGFNLPVCTGPVRELFLDTAAFLPSDGDELVLFDAGGGCADYVAFEDGPDVNGPPAGCAWSGPNPSNGGFETLSLSRFDADPFVDTDSGSDWEPSGASTTRGPMTPGAPNDPPDGDDDGFVDAVDNCPDIGNPDQADGDGDGIGQSCDNCPFVASADPSDSDLDGAGDPCDACPLDRLNDADADGVCGNMDNCPALANNQMDSDGDGVGDACEGLLQSVELPVTQQDIRNVEPEFVQHRQQSVTRVGRRFDVLHRALGRIDVAAFPAGAVVQSVSFVYHTTSGDPAEVENNGDLPPLGGPIGVEVRELLVPWNFDEPLTHPEEFSDNHLPIALGQTNWPYSAFPVEWSAPGGAAPTDFGPVLALQTVPSALDVEVEFTGDALNALVQAWINGTSPNYGFMLKASDADEQAAGDNWKVLCGKGFPLETSTGLSAAEAQSHRPFVRIDYWVPGAVGLPVELRRLRPVRHQVMAEFQLHHELRP